MNGMITLAFKMSELSPAARIAIPFLGVLLITISMMMGIRKKLRRSQTRGTAREQVQELKQKKAVRGDLEQLMVEIEQLAKRFGAQLDAKTVRMERLIDEADRKIGELKQLDRARRDADEPQPACPPQPTTPNPQPPTPDDALKRSVYHLAEQGLDPAGIAHQLNEHVGKIELILALRKT